MRVAKCLLAFDSLCGARAWVTERLLDYSEYLLDSYCHCRALTEVAKCVLAFNSLFEAQTENINKLSTVFAKLERGLENTYKLSTVFTKLKWGLLSVS